MVFNNTNIKILIQTDTAQFVDYINSKFINSSQLIIFNEIDTSYTNTGSHFENTPEQNYQNISYLFASILIISKCRYIICSSGNVSYWIALYRGNAINIYQNLNKTWINNNLVKIGPYKISNKLMFY